LVQALSYAQSEDRSQATSFSLRLTEDRDVNVSSRQGLRNTLFITERYVKLYEFELWSGLKVNRKKTCAMVVERRGKNQCQMDETLVYMGQEVTFLAPSTACRYLGVWGTPTGDMSSTKEKIFKKTEEARDLLRHHPLTPEQAIDLFTSIGVGAFRYSAALVPWTEKELERLEAVWVQAYKWAWGLPRTTASDVFTLPSGMEYLRGCWRRNYAATCSGALNMKMWPGN
jgi:hypothetical protein